MYCAQFGRFVLFPLNNVFVRSISKLKQKLKVKCKKLWEETKKYLSIHRGVVSPFVRQVPCASAGGWPQRTTHDAPLSLPSSASFAFTEALSATAEALPKAAKPSTAQWLQPSSFLGESFFTPPHGTPATCTLRKGALWLRKDNGPRNSSWELQRAILGAKLVLEPSLPPCSLCKEGDSSVNFMNRSIVLL